MRNALTRRVMGPLASAVLPVGKGIHVPVVRTKELGRHAGAQLTGFHIVENHTIPSPAVGCGLKSLVFRARNSCAVGFERF